jgi:hypothetical protein
MKPLERIKDRRTYVCMYVCTYVCVYVCMYVCIMYVYMYVCMYVCTYICVNVCMYEFIAKRLPHYICGCTIRLRTMCIRVKTHLFSVMTIRLKTAGLS